MNKIEIIVVGELKEKGFKLLEQEYMKRLSKYCKLNMIVLKDESNSINKETVLLKEGERILKVVDKKSFIISLELSKNQLSSEEFANKITNISTYHSSKITFIIGGSLGISKSVLDVSDFSLTFSKMTFPHHLFRIMFLEQLYRAYKINEGSNYHK